MIDSNFNIFINKKTIPINDRAFNYGDGLFETLLIKDGNAIYLKEHVNRLHRGCETLLLKKPSFSLIREHVKRAIGNSKNCILKIVLSRGADKFGYQFSKKLIPNLYFIKVHDIKEKIVTEKKINVGFSKYKPANNNTLSKIKHLNRLDQCLIASELGALENQYDDLAVTHDKNIIETLSSNLFFVKKIKNNYVFDTPIISSFGVNGIIRQKILEFLQKKKIKSNIINIKKNNLQKYSACFKVNSIKGLVFIDRMGKNKFSKPEMLYNILKSFIY
tara:strand:+ start:1796 stop:2620 length:825 start_codon:yes stop_codon:yes gene_type:complete